MEKIIALSQILLFWGIYYTITKKISLTGYVFSLVFFLTSFSFLNKNAILLVLPFFYFYSRTEKFSRALSFFLAVYTSTVGLILTNVVEQTFIIFVSYNTRQKYSDILAIISLILPIFINYLMMKIYRIDWRLLNKNETYIQNRVVKPLNIVLFGLYLSFLGIYYYEVYFSLRKNESSRYLVFILMLIFFGMETYISQKIDRYFHHEVQKIKDKQLQQLTSYTDEIESMYKTLRGFRHDYTNIFLSLKSSIEDGDLDEIKKVYANIENSPTIKLANRSHFSGLSNIKNSALKSVLYWKLTEAKKDNLNVKLEVEEVIEDVKIDIIDFVRVISILIDNAIEEAKKTSQPTISLALFKKQDDLVIIVKNNKSSEDIPLGKIFSENFSTKKNHQGTGLYNLHKIIKSYDFVNLDTQITDDSFVQTISIGSQA